MLNKKITFGTIILVVFTSIISLSLAQAIHDQTYDTVKKETVEAKKLYKVTEYFEKFEIPSFESATQYPTSMVITKNGAISINNAEVISIESSTLKIKVWGITLSVNTNGTTIVPESTSLEEIQVGDKVNIKGTINNETGIITADKIHALSARNKLIDQLRTEIDELLAKIKEMQKKLEELGGKI